MTTLEPSSPTNAFDQAAKSALRDAALPAPPAWMDAQIITAAHNQAPNKTAPAPHRAHAWWQAPWFKVALPSVVVGTVLVRVWMPETTITRDSVQLPEAVHVPAPTRIPAPAAASAPMRPPPAVVQEASDIEKAAATSKEEAPIPPAFELKKAAPKPQIQPPAAPPAPPAPTAKHETRARDPAVSALPAAPAPAAKPLPAADAPAVLLEATAAKSAEHARTAVPAAQDTDTAAVQAQFAAIRKLLADGQPDIARERLIAMVKRAPELQIPADLQVLMPKP